MLLAHVHPLGLKGYVRVLMPKNDDALTLVSISSPLQLGFASL